MSSEDTPDNTPRIRLIAEAMKDEGIVQPVSKEMEQLSRRLHQKCRFSGEIRRACFSPGGIRYGVVHGRRTRQLQPEVAAYIAGLIDGEGTITLTRLHANENRRLVVSIANTEFQLLQFVIDHAGAGKITRKKTTSDRHTPSYCYAVTRRQALALLEQITPHLRSYKRRRAELAREHYESLTPRTGKYTAAALAERHRFEQALLSMNSRTPTKPSGRRADA